jgi:hypothetical protein
MRKYEAVRLYKHCLKEQKFRAGNVPEAIELLPKKFKILCCTSPSKKKKAAKVEQHTVTQCSMTRRCGHGGAVPCWGTKQPWTVTGVHKVPRLKVI